MSRGWILDLDMGNTRIKWRLRTAGKLGSSGAMLYDSELHASASVSILNAMPEAEGLSRIRIASVAGSERNQMLRRWCLQSWQLEPEFARVSAVCAGVSNGYRDFRKIGVDRWLGVLAAYHHCRRSCLVVDCGSAVTVDMVTGSGEHLGGYIVPGLHLMRQALFRETDAVKVAAAQVLELQMPGRDTGEAVNKGQMLMVLGLISESRRQLAQLVGETVGDELPLVILTGGDAPEVGHHLRGACEHLPQLVLDGLALAIP